MNKSEMEVFLAEHKEKLRQEIRAEIEQLFKREREDIQERARFYLAFARWAGIVTVGILAALGITKGADIQQFLEEHFKNRLENQYKIGDPDSTFTVDINRLMDQALLASVYVEALAANTSQDTYDSTGVGRRADIARLLTIAKKQTTTPDDFERAVEGLSYLADTRTTRANISSDLVDMLMANEAKGYSWMAKAEQKKLTILEFPKSSQINEAAESLLSSDMAEAVAEAIIDRFRTERYRRGSKSLSKFGSATTNDVLKYEAFMTVARLDPYDSALEKYVQNDLIPNSHGADVTRNLLLAMEIFKTVSNQGSDDSPAQDIIKTNKIISDLVIPIWAKAFDSDITIRYIKSSDVVSINDIQGYNVSLGHEMYSSEFISLLLMYANKISTQELLKYTSSLAHSGGSHERPYKIWAVIDEHSTVVDENGHTVNLEGATSIEIEQSSAPTVRLSSEHHKPRSTNAQLTWTNRNGKVSTIAGRIINPASFGMEAPVSGA